MPRGGASPRVPQCPACKAAGARPVRTLRWFRVDGRTKVVTVVRGGRAVTREVAWTACGRVCGWRVCGQGWWSAHPAIVALARRHAAHEALPRHAKPPGFHGPGRGYVGRMDAREWRRDLHV
jgi:hypothetical protein